MFFKRTLAAGALVIASAVAANAADLTPIMPAPAAPAPMAPAPAPSWTGAYFGGFGALTVPFGGGPPVFGTLGVIGGYDIQAGNFVFGFSTRPSITFLGGPFLLNTDGNIRAGYLINNRLLAYAVTGLGVSFPGPAYWNLGGGVEFAVNDTIHVFGEVKRAWATGGGGPIGTAVVTGITFR